MVNLEVNVPLAGMIVLSLVFVILMTPHKVKAVAVDPGNTKSRSSV